MTIISEEDTNMFKSVGKFIWRMAKCVIGAAAVGFIGYWGSKFLNLVTDAIIKAVDTALEYFTTNWWAVIVVIVTLIVGGLAFDGVANGFHKWRSNRKGHKAQN